MNKPKSTRRRRNEAIAIAANAFAQQVQMIERWSDTEDEDEKHENKPRAQTKTAKPKQATAEKWENRTNEKHESQPKMEPRFATRLAREWHEKNLDTQGKKGFTFETHENIRQWSDTEDENDKQEKKPHDIVAVQNKANEEKANKPVASALITTSPEELIELFEYSTIDMKRSLPWAIRKHLKADKYWCNGCNDICVLDLDSDGCY